MSGNILDWDYNSYEDLPNILSQWASQCVAAYNINETSCSFAEKSIKAADPATDILSRIQSITANFANNAQSGQSFENMGNNILYFSNLIEDSLFDPAGWSFLGSYLSLIEDAFENDPPPQPSLEDFQEPSGYNENLTLSSYESLGSPPYSFNPTSDQGLICVDGSLENISTDDTFARYLAGLISQNAWYSVLMAYPSVYLAICLSWPNATVNNAEIFRSPFPSSVNNKILMVVETLSTGWSYQGALSTYEYIGGKNAVWLTHDAIGDGVYWDPNNCTYNAIRQFLLAGITR